MLIHMWMLTPSSQNMLPTPNRSPVPGLHPKSNRLFQACGEVVINEAGEEVKYLDAESKGAGALGEW